VYCTPATAYRLCLRFRGGDGSTEYLPTLISRERRRGERYPPKNTWYFWLVLSYPALVRAHRGAAPSFCPLSWLWYRLKNTNTHTHTPHAGIFWVSFLLHQSLSLHPVFCLGQTDFIIPQSTLHCTHECRVLRFHRLGTLHGGLSTGGNWAGGVKLDFWGVFRLLVWGFSKGVGLVF